ncbi:rhodanese-like domain-containing protein, partial [Chloroflexota bacterium]
KEIMDKDNKGDYLLLDVREPEEYEANHIAGAFLIPMGELEARQNELNRSKKIILYCRSGHRSMAAAIVLCGLGFDNLHHLSGGIMQWTYSTIAGAHEKEPLLIPLSLEVHDIFVLAIKLERGSCDFYNRATEKVKEPEIKQLFQMLASYESEHLHRLYQQASDVITGFPTLDSIMENVDIVHMEGGIEINPVLFKLETGLSGEIDALEISLEKEYMAYDLYIRGARIIKDRDAGNLLSEFALEERKHADMVLGKLKGIISKRG